MVEIKHAKTNTIPSWTQADIDAQILAGNLPAGTTPADITLSEDWNDDHTITGTIPSANIGAAGSSGQVQYNNSGVLGGATNAYYDSATQRLGINTDTPEGVLHIKEGSYTLPPDPTGSVTLSETDIGSGFWTNDGNAFTVSVHTYKVVEGVTLYSTNGISTTYSDDFAADHTYNLLVELSDALPAGADGYRAFVQWTDNTATVQWDFNRYFQFTDLDVTINGSPTTGGAISGTVVYKTIHDGVEAWFKHHARFMDSSGTTHAIWDAVNKRLGVGTDAPTQFAHFKSTATTLPPNPTGTVTPTQVSESEDDPYNADGSTHAYRVYTYKIVGGQIILSNTFISGSFQDDESENLYYVNIAMSAAVPSGADGYFVIKASLNYSTVNYWIGGQNIEDRANYTSDNRAQFSTAIGRTLIDTANFEIVQNGTRRLFFDTADGSFDTLKVKTRNINQHGLRIECINGQSANPISVVNSAGSNLFSVTAAGALSFSGSINATSATLSAGLSGTTAAFSSNVTVGGTLAVTSAVTLTSTITARTATFTATNSGSIGLTVNGVSGQTANLVQIRATSGGTILASISAAGVYDTTQLVQSAAGFRLTAFGAYVGVQSAARCTFGNASGVSTFGTGNTAHVVSLIEAPTGQTADIQQWRVNSVALAGITAAGKQYFDATNTAAGTTGNQTINKPSGTVNFAAGATAITVTNSTVTANSIVLCVVRTNDATATIKNVVPAAGSFTINLNAAATAETSVGFIVYN